MVSFEIFRTADNSYGWRLRADNGETIAYSGDQYVTKEAVQRAIDAIKRDAGVASVRDLSQR